MLFVFLGIALKVKFLVTPTTTPKLVKVKKYPNHLNVNTLLLAVSCRAAAGALLNHTSIAQGL